MVGSVRALAPVLSLIVIASGRPACAKLETPVNFGAMSTVSILIPQIGEGLQEARLVAVLKKPGDSVHRDEPIYQMETDKAVMDVESPYDGVLLEWTAQVDDIIPIGAEVAKMTVTSEVSEGDGSPGESPAASERREKSEDSSRSGANRIANVPPRTRAYAKEKGVSEEDLAQLAATGNKLMPSDIDVFLTGHGKVQPSKRPSKDTPLSQQQRLLSSRLSRGTKLVVPGTISVVSHWGPIETLRGRIKASGSHFQPSAFTMFAFGVVQALKSHPLFRSTLVGDDTVRTFDHVSLGIAVGLPGDELVLAVIDGADEMSWKEFATAAKARIEEAREGKDQAHEAMTISLTNMQSFGLRDAVPVVVPPAIATLFLGEVYTGIDPTESELKPARLANLAMTFDHRLINGVGAAKFIADVKKFTEEIDLVVDL